MARSPQEGDHENWLGMQHLRRSAAQRSAADRFGCLIIGDLWLPLRALTSPRLERVDTNAVTLRIEMKRSPLDYLRFDTRE